MVQGVVIGGMLYGFLVFLLSILLVKIHIINSPVLKKGFLSSVFLIIGPILAISGFYVYAHSKMLGIMCCIIGVSMDVLKISSDIFHAKTAQKSGSNAQDNLKENHNPELSNSSEKSKLVEHEANDANSVVSDNTQHIQEQATLKAISTGFVYPYFSLYFCFSFCIILFIIAVIISLMEIMYDKAELDNITKFLKLITSFDFTNKTMQSASGAQRYAVTAAYAIASGIVILILILVFGLAMRILKKKSIHIMVVQPLLAGQKKDFLPCSEGIYKVCYRNLLTGNRFYCLYPWDKLSLYAINDKCKKIVLKTGKMQMPLIPWGGNYELYNSIKSVVLRHLPEERQRLLAKRDRYGWGRVAIAALIFVVLLSSLAGWLESVSDKGNKYCDVRDEIHGNRTFWSRNVPALEVYDNNGKILHKYCYFHAPFYVLLHPSEYIRSFNRMIKDIPRLKDDLLVIEWLIFPPAVWLSLLAGALCAGKRHAFRISRL